MIFLDEDEGLQHFLEEEYKISTSYKETTDTIRVSISPFNTAFEIDILGRAIDAYNTDEIVPTKSF